MRLVKTFVFLPCFPVWKAHRWKDNNHDNINNSWRNEALCRLTKKMTVLIIRWQPFHENTQGRTVCFETWSRFQFGIGIQKYAIRGRKVQTPCFQDGAHEVWPLDLGEAFSICQIAPWTPNTKVQKAILSWGNNTITRDWCFHGVVNGKDAASRVIQTFAKKKYLHI